MLGADTSTTARATHSTCDGDYETGNQSLLCTTTATDTDRSCNRSLLSRNRLCALLTLLVISVHQAAIFECLRDSSLASGNALSTDPNGFYVLELSVVTYHGTSEIFGDPSEELTDVFVQTNLASPSDSDDNSVDVAPTFAQFDLASSRSPDKNSVDNNTTLVQIDLASSSDFDENSTDVALTFVQVDLASSRDSDKNSVDNDTVFVQIDLASSHGIDENSIDVALTIVQVDLASSRDSDENLVNNDTTFVRIDLASSSDSDENSVDVALVIVQVDLASSRDSDKNLVDVAPNNVQVDRASSRDSDENSDDAVSLPILPHVEHLVDNATSLVSLLVEKKDVSMGPLAALLHLCLVILLLSVRFPKRPRLCCKFHAHDDPDSDHYPCHGSAARRVPRCTTAYEPTFEDTFILRLDGKYVLSREAKDLTARHLRALVKPCPRRTLHGRSVRKLAWLWRQHRKGTKRPVPTVAADKGFRPESDFRIHHVMDFFCVF
eukprot:135107-Amphidinium_carterae.1